MKSTSVLSLALVVCPLAGESLVVPRHALAFVLSASRRSGVEQRASSTDSVPDLVSAYRKVSPPVEAAPSIPLPVETPPPAVTEAVEPAKSAINDFLEAVDQSMDSAGDAVSAAASSVQVPANPFGNFMSGFDAWKANIAAQKAAAPRVTVEPGKAPTLAQFLKSPSGAGAGYDGNMATAKANLEKLLDNTYALFGKEAPEGALDNINVDSIKQGFSSVEPSTLGWVAAGTALLVAAGQRQAGEAEARSQMQDLIKKEAGAVKELAEQLSSMSDEIKSLKKDTKNLQTRLNKAVEELTQKELEIGKERVKVAEQELQLKREVEKYKAQAVAGEAKVKKLESQLKETANIKSELAAATEKVRQMEEDLRKARGLPVPDEDLVSTMEDDVPELATKSSGETVAVLESPPAAKKASAKKKAAKKKAAKKSTAKASSATAKVTEKSAPTEVVAPAPADDWSSLSDSTLMRKTVAELKEYLGARGVDTKDMKKANLVEAVKSN